MANPLKAAWQAGATTHGAWLSIPSALSAEVVARIGWPRSRRSSPLAARENSDKRDGGGRVN